MSGLEKDKVLKPKTTAFWKKAFTFNQHREILFFEESEQCKEFPG
jgi:hypothetical protein